MESDGGPQGSDDARTAGDRRGRNRQSGIGCISDTRVARLQLDAARRRIAVALSAGGESGTAGEVPTIARSSPQPAEEAAATDRTAVASAPQRAAPNNDRRY